MKKKQVGGRTVYRGDYKLYFETNCEYISITNYLNFCFEKTCRMIEDTDETLKILFEDKSFYCVNKQFVISYSISLKPPKPPELPENQQLMDYHKIDNFNWRIYAVQYLESNQKEVKELLKGDIGVKENKELFFVRKRISYTVKPEDWIIFLQDGALELLTDKQFKSVYTRHYESYS